MGLLHAFLVRISGSPSNKTIGLITVTVVLKRSNWYDFVQHLRDMTVVLRHKTCSQDITEVQCCPIGACEGMPWI